jgi:hypothetical protein
MSVEDDVKQAIDGLENMVAQDLYGVSSSGTSIDVGNDLSIGTSTDSTISTDITSYPQGISTSDIVFGDAQTGWGTITIQAGPWELSGKPNGDLEIVFETKDERKEYHIHHEKIVALLEKVADVKVEGKKEDD